MKRLLLLLLYFSSLLLSSSVVPDDYLLSQEDEFTYLYTKEHAALMPQIKNYQKELVRGYEKEFGYALDDTLYVGMASSKNQIANGFSTQTPLNLQLFYGAGASYIDYFSSTSWLKTLLIHETAHTFQLNPKENMLSKISHKVLGNTPVSFLGPLPLFPIPNILESSFILEGNGVMNESRFGNGGRLFSGYALAELIALARAGEIKPELMINPTLNFPYGEKFYLVGGFFQQFLVKKYGVERVNGYFKTFASQSFPFFTSAMFKKHYGKRFELLLEEFVEEIKQKHATFRATKAKALVRSQIFVPLNKTEHEIHTLIGDNLSTPKLLILNTQTMELTLKEDAYRVGELFKIDGAYYTFASAKTSPFKVEMGLFDKEGFLKKGSEGKALQGFTTSGKMVYFDIAKSIERPQIYVDGTFYAESSSSVYVNGEDIYYFKQEGEKRTLYKNREALLAFMGHYGFVVDVDAMGFVYFITNSKDGSTVYRTKNGVVERVNLADDIIDFKLLNEHEALVVTVDAYGYAYAKVALTPLKEGLSSPMELPKQDGKLSKLLREKNLFDKESKLESKPYSAIKALKYSSLNQALSYGSYTGFGLDAQINFVDPLLQNALSVLLSSNNQREIVGVRYENEANRVLYGGAIYGHFAKSNALLKNRNRGYDAHLKLPLLTSGYWDAKLTLAYTQDYENLYREPLNLSFNLTNLEQFGFSKYPNRLNQLNLFVGSDRGTTLWGSSYTFRDDLPWQSYWGFKANYIQSSEVQVTQERGIELREGFGSLQSERASLSIPSFSTTTYAKAVKMAELSLAKVFDGSLYFFSFPLSLQREALYAKGRLYEIDFTPTTQQTYYESTLGVELDLLLFNKLEMPLNIEWIQNQEVADSNKLRIFLSNNF